MEERFYFKEINWFGKKTYKILSYLPVSYIFYFLFVIIPYPLVYWYQRKSYVAIKNGFLNYVSFGKEVWKISLSDIILVDEKQKEIFSGPNPKYETVGFFIKANDPKYRTKEDIYTDQITASGGHIAKEDFMKTKIVRIRHILEDYEYFISRLLQVNPNIKKTDVNFEYNQISGINVDLRKLFFHKTKKFFLLSWVGKILVKSNKLTTLLIFIIIYISLVILFVMGMIKLFQILK